MKKTILVLAIIILGMADAQAKELRVYMDWFNNIEFAGMFVAYEKGWYKKEGIDLKFVFNGLDIVDNVIAGQADIGMHSAHEIIRYASKGSKIKAFAAKYQLNPNCIILDKRLHIDDLRQLKSKTLGVFQDSEYEIYRVMLGNVGLKLTDVKFKKITTFKEAELIHLLKTKQVDGMIAWEFNWTVTFALLGYPVKVFPGYDHGFNFYGIVYFTTDEFLKINKDLLKKYLEITFRGWEEVYKKPEFYTRHIVDAWYPKENYINGSKSLTYKQQLLELKLRKRYLFEGVGTKGIGTMSQSRWKNSIEIAKAAQIIKPTSMLKAEDVYDMGILKMLKRSE